MLVQVKQTPREMKNYACQIKQVSQHHEHTNIDTHNQEAKGIQSHVKKSYEGFVVSLCSM